MTDTMLPNTSLKAEPLSITLLCLPMADNKKTHEKKTSPQR